MKQSNLVRATGSWSRALWDMRALPSFEVRNDTPGAEDNRAEEYNDVPPTMVVGSGLVDY